jgi:Uma2 family endonuclease
MQSRTRASIADLYELPGDGKAEIVDGEVVLVSPAGDLPGRASLKLTLSLYEYESRTGLGRAYPDNTGFRVNLPNRESFSPDASFYAGPRTGGKFLEGAPRFAAEIRSEGDYGPAAERAMAAKRADYFAAGTQVVWDVDVLQDRVVRVYRATDPENATVYRRGQAAEAEPALPGWRMAVDDLLD